MNNASMNSGPNTAVMNRLEIELIAGRYSDEESREVRVILLRQDVGV